MHLSYTWTESAPIGTMESLTERSAHAVYPAVSRHNHTLRIDGVVTGPAFSV